MTKYFAGVVPTLRIPCWSPEPMNATLPLVILEAVSVDRDFERSVDHQEHFLSVMVMRRMRLAVKGKS